MTKKALECTPQFEEPKDGAPSHDEYEEWKRAVAGCAVLIDGDQYVRAVAAIKKQETERRRREEKIAAEQQATQRRETKAAELFAYTPASIADNFKDLAHEVMHLPSTERKPIYDLLRAKLESRIETKDELSTDELIDTALAWELWGILFTHAAIDEDNQELADHLANHSFKPKTGKMRNVEHALMARRPPEANREIYHSTIIEPAEESYHQRALELAEKARTNLEIE